MHAWVGKILRVNLTKGVIKSEPLKDEMAKNYMGTRGFGVKCLYEEMDPKVDALSPKNILIFATGPLTGTGTLAGGRYMVMTKSPLTGGIANSNSGGHFGAELKYAGYDMIIIEGKSKNPVYLWIENDQVEIRSAKNLWGKDVPQTTELIQSETDAYAKVACIGPAGENLVKFASIMNDNGRAAGRSGVGAVMGSKNLKAVSIRGTNGVTVADPKGFRDSVLHAMEEIKTDPTFDKFEKAYGTTWVVDFCNELGILPTRNFQFGVFEGADKIGSNAIATKYNIRGAAPTKSCFGCPLGCGRITRVPNGEFKGQGEGPEYETIGSLGSVCGVDNIEAICKANYICNDLGMDTISMGATIGCAMELYEKGYLPEVDAGVKLNFGNAQALVELVEKTAYRDGFGNVLAEGSYRMAEKYGHPELSMSIKKQELPNYDPRGGEGMALGFATVPRGGDHMRGEVGCIEIFGIALLGINKTGENVDPYTTKGKGKFAKIIQDYYCVMDMIGMCNFLTLACPDERAVVDLIEKATGIEYGIEGILKVGDRVFTLERLFNLKAGLTAKDDSLPKRMLEEPMPEGPVKGHVVHLDKMLPEFYKARGMDENGIPTKEKLKELGINY